ncbi:zinc ABC transporter substrate-binding protein [Halocella sp. SP3-1]|uniref:metal ABC transporter solute-binding protein, Zn/Mn family n=1 Tax=Halocella sp. SP3-1 TaxID=2382161 RepID=UPI00336A24FB
MRKNKIFMILLAVIVIVLLAVWGASKSKISSSEKYKVVTTTTMLTDLTSVIAGDLIEVKGLMGPGIDPHLYKASAGDVVKMRDASMVIFNGLHLEGKMGEIFENLREKNKFVIEIAENIDEKELICLGEELYDPHIWFNVLLWKDAAVAVCNGLVELDAQNKEFYTENLEKYLKELDTLHKYVLERIKEIPKESRILITAHDAFAYFGNTYGFEVKGLQGISTASEAGTRDVRQLAEYIVEKQIKAIFVESSVPKKNIEALQEAVAARGFKVEIGGELYSDSLGSPGTEAETYIGTVKSNVDTIIDALK